MILGVGSDIADIDRIGKTLEQHGDRFIARYFTQEEIDHVSAAARGDAARTRAGFAKRWAAKEAAAKALGTGIRDGIFMKDFSVSNDASGRPALGLSGGAQEKLQQLLPAGADPAIHLSLSDDGGYALAFVVISATQRTLP